MKTIKHKCTYKGSVFDCSVCSKQAIGITPGGHCSCGEALPDVRDDQTPFEFCSIRCRDYSKLLEACKSAADAISKDWKSCNEATGEECEGFACYRGEHVAMEILDHAITEVKS